ncbi:hypothetical protein BD408DRAFT_423200 [Parasitella parasitica]|nr:hypothetical protein BD408DRAFT_423200 [Parasitella parasitica]
MTDIYAEEKDRINAINICLFLDLVVSGSTMSTMIPKASSVDLTSDFISGLPTMTAAATAVQPSQIMYTITACSTCSSSSSSSSGAAAVASVANDTNNKAQLSSSDLGAIIGGCAGGLVAFVVVTAVLICARKKQIRNFHAGRNFRIITAAGATVTGTTEMPSVANHDAKQTYPSAKVPNNSLSSHSFHIDTNDSTIKRYNLSVVTDNTTHVGPTTPPVILYPSSPQSTTKNKIWIRVLRIAQP